MTGVTTDGACQERDLAEGFPPFPSPGAPGRARPWAPASPLQPPPPPPQLPDCSQMWQLINSFLWVTTLSGICQCFEPNATVSDHCANTPVGTACRHLRRVSALPPLGGQGACMRRLGLPRGPFQPAGGDAHGSVATCASRSARHAETQRVPAGRGRSAPWWRSAGGSGEAELRGPGASSPRCCGDVSVAAGICSASLLCVSEPAALVLCAVPPRPAESFLPQTAYAPLFPAGGAICNPGARGSGTRISPESPR